MSNCTARSDNDIDQHHGHFAVDFVIFKKQAVSMGVSIFHSEQCARSSLYSSRNYLDGHAKLAKGNTVNPMSVSILFLPEVIADNNAYAKKGGATQEPDRPQKALRQEHHAQNEGALAVDGHADYSSNRGVR
jgi:hypothetical protein